MTNGQTYLDTSYNGAGNPDANGSALSGGLGKLVDGVVGQDDWQADSADYVGWTASASPVAITFEFGMPVDLTEFSVFVNNSDLDGAQLYSSLGVSFSTDDKNFSTPVVFDTSADSMADPDARFLHYVLDASMGATGVRRPSVNWFLSAPRNGRF